MLSAEISTLAEQWLQWDMDPTTRAQVQHWIDAKDEKSLSAAMKERIAFGTAGLRGEMKAGFANMNMLTVTQVFGGFFTFFFFFF